MERPILTDANGRPFERPEPPPEGAPIEQTIAWMRALHDYNDAVADTANRAFTDEFCKAIRR